MDQSTDEQKPGAVITPGQSVPTQQPAVETPVPSLAATAPVNNPPASQPTSPEPEITAEDAAKYQTPAQFTQETNPETEYTGQEDAISWSASEYIAHHKSGGWYAAFGLITLGVLVAIYFITSGDILSVVVIAVVAVVFGLYAARQPKEQQYSVSDQGITVGPKAYSFHDFKSFSVIDEGAFSSISFMPLKRFMPIISIYYAPDDEERIVDALSIYLPFDEKQADPVDRFMKKIRF
jgi:hypothetical protein